MVDNSVECEEMEEYFGERLKNVKFYQFSYQQFQLDCLSKNSTSYDSTGKRLYAGGHVGIRFLQFLSPIVNHKALLELGCGTGIIGLSLLLEDPISSPAKLLLTDGALPTLQITEKNVQKILSTSSSSCSVTIQELLWGNTSHLTQALQYNCSKFYDIIIGCELMYFSTDIPLLFSTINGLMDREEGIFVHVHHFRRDQQETEMIEECQKYDWITVEVSKSNFISRKELDQHPEWYQIRALITGRKAAVERIVEAMKIPFILFTPQMPEDDEDEEQINSRFVNK